MHTSKTPHSFSFFANTSLIYLMTALTGKNNEFKKIATRSFLSHFLYSSRSLDMLFLSLIMRIFKLYLLYLIEFSR